jgi:hypothetical protein
MKKVSFYTDFGHEQFLNVFRTEIEELEKRRVDYVIFENPDMIIPKMSIDGTTVLGLDNIKDELKYILKE